MSLNKNIKNLKGILYYMEYPVLEFQIENSKLISSNNISKGKFLPEMMAANGISYETIRDFFCDRMIEKDSMYYQEGFVRHKENLYMMGADSEYLDLYIRNTNGNNNVDNYWIKFEDIGVQAPKLWAAKQHFFNEQKAKRLRV